ncbi:MAG TPA: hypothetical protein DIT25_03840 [Candidatus Moranbacteria bacterium]|nr:hypothetical protein [Candidatus Moranbacteria bacterium]
MQRKKEIFCILVFSLLFSAGGSFASSEELELGSFDRKNSEAKFFRPLSLKIKDSSFELSPGEAAKFIIEKESLIFSPDYKSEIENTNFCDYKNSIICHLLFSHQHEARIRKNSNFYLDMGFLSQFLEDLARQVDKDPENAKFQADDSGKISAFSLSKDGLALDREKNMEILAKHYKNDALKDDIELAYKIIRPEIYTDSIENLGITALIGQGKSNFSGSPENRIFNIKVATGRFNGLLIKPDEEFSFVKTLGEVDGEHGYLPELVIKNNKTEPEFGGGICQVSTTAFRAAIFSGLKITARKNHAYPVKYYAPHGMDSTIYIPYPDLRFKNNTPGHILIQARIVGTELFFDFYGTPDGREVKVDGPKITERNPDGSMKTTFTQEVFDKDGSVLIKDVFNSAYDSPDKYPQPGQILAKKPVGWSDNEWKKYKKENNL